MAHTAGRPVVLIVDEDNVFVHHLRHLLEQEGLDCLSAGTAAATIAILDTTSVDLVLCDAALTDTDCRGVSEHVAAHPSKPAILCVTGLNDADNAVQSLRGSGIPVLFKPVDASELGHWVAWALHERFLRLQGLPASDLAALYRIATAVNGGVLSAPLFERVLNLTLDALAGDSGSIMLASTGPGPRTLNIAASFGLEFDASRPAPQFGSGVAGWIAAHARPLRLVGSLDAYPQFRGMSSNPKVGVSLVAPLLFRREVLGTICVNSSTPGRFGPEKLALLVSIAEVLAAALQRQRMERAREHQDRLAMLGQLSASIAHELNNPLSTLKSNVTVLSQLLAEPDAPDTRREMQSVVTDVQDAVERMVSLIRTLQGTARKPTEQLNDVEIDALLSRAEVLVHPQFKHRVRLVVERGATSPRVQVEAGRITQILINLLINASHVVGEGGQVTLRSRVDEHWACVDVEDNGPGIPPEVAGHLFEPFFTTKPEGEGTGLGLSISRQIARECGGDLTFTTRVGAGTCFTLKLPLLSEDEPPHATVLVVDDEPLLLHAVERLLRRCFRVVKASSPAEALAVAARINLDLIITDYSMPGQNGVALIKELRRLGNAVPAALLTAVAESEDIRDAVRSGLVVRVLAKPWNSSTLAAEVQALVEDVGRK